MQRFVKYSNIFLFIEDFSLVFRHVPNLNDLQAMYEDASQVATDAVGSIRTVASFCAEEKVIELYRKKCEGPKKTGIRQGLVSGTGFGISSGTLFFVYAVSFYAGARFVAQGITTFENVYRVRTYIFQTLVS